MPAIAAIKIATALAAASVLKTGSATVGYDATLSPDGLAAPGVYKWVDRAGGIQVGFPNLTVSMRKPTRDSRLTRVTIKYSFPTLATTAPTTSTGIQPAPEKAYDHSVVMEFFLPERGTLAERESFFSQVLSLFVATINASDDVPTDATGSPLRTMITTLEPPFSG